MSTRDDAEPEGSEPIRIIPFDPTIDRSTFACGQGSVDAWFATQAGRSDRVGAPRTFLAVRGRSVAGFYASVVTQMGRDEVAEAFGIGKSRYPKPAVLLAQLGVDRTEQGRGLGRLLLVHALTSFLEASKLVGFEVVLVDALSSEVCAFYRKMGFTSLEDHPLRLFMTVKTLRATFDSID